jgi:hypothetical protein
MIERILSIAGKPGLFKLVSQGKNMLIVEALQTGKRTPAYPHDKVISLADIAIYTTDEDIPLYEVFEKVSAKTEGKPVDVKALGADENIRSYFGEILPEFDSDRVYTTDIKKLFSWYNQLLAAGITKFVEEKPAKEESAE